MDIPKVLFVSSVNIINFGISPIVKNQLTSLSKKGIDGEYFTINGKGFRNYLKSIINLKSI
jgi:hypothetical protein